VMFSDESLSLTSDRKSTAQFVLNIRPEESATL
jgi:hypothetical protein